MRKRALSVLLAILVLCFASPVTAEEDGSEGPSNKQVGLGILGGAAFPIANEQNFRITESWGFFVDIPIISTFHITPSTILYRLEHESDSRIGNHGITDISLNFKFVIPVSTWKIFIAAMMGLSNGSFVHYVGDDDDDKTNSDPVQMHFGGNAGFGYRIVSNLDFIALCQYKLIVDGDQRNINMIQAMGGLQFNF